MSKTNAYCQALGIQVPRLEIATSHPDANYYSLLIVVLLESGQPITLEQAARRFAQAGIAPPERALASLKRCKPGRPPIYRDGDLYALDPHDDEADLWAFRLGLRPPRVPALRVIRSDPTPLPEPGKPLAAGELAEAWREGVPNTWSAQRIACCVLDAHGAAMRAEDVVAFVARHGPWSQLSTDSARYWRRGAPIRARNDGLWELDREHAALRSARQAVRERITMFRRWTGSGPTPRSFCSCTSARRPCSRPRSRGRSPPSLIFCSSKSTRRLEFPSRTCRRSRATSPPSSTACGDSARDCQLRAPAPRSCSRMHGRSGAIPS